MGNWDVLLNKFMCTPLVEKSEDKYLFYFLGDENYSLAVDGFVVSFEELRMVAVVDYDSYSELKFSCKGFKEMGVVSIIVSDEQYGVLRFYKS